MLLSTYLSWSSESHYQKTKAVAGKKIFFIGLPAVLIFRQDKVVFWFGVGSAILRCHFSYKAVNRSKYIFMWLAEAFRYFQAVRAWGFPSIMLSKFMPLPPIAI